MTELLGEWVELTWSGVSTPAETDWIGVYSPSTVDIKKTKPVKYLFPSKVVPTYLKTGSGSWSFRLLNLRADYRFVLYRNGLDRPVYAGQSNTVTFANVNEPLGAHLSVGVDHTSRIVSWNSGTVPHACLCNRRLDVCIHTKLSPLYSFVHV
jgi:hypothetical protein